MQFLVWAITNFTTSWVFFEKLGELELAKISSIIYYFVAQTINKWQLYDVNKFRNGDGRDQARIQDFEMGGEFLSSLMHILHLNQRIQRNPMLFQYLSDKKKKKGGGSEKGGVKIHPFHLPWIRAWGYAIHELHPPF